MSAGVTIELLVLMSKRKRLLCNYYCCGHASYNSININFIQLFLRRVWKFEPFGLWTITDLLLLNDVEKNETRSE